MIKLGFANYPKIGPEYPACRFGRVPGYPTIKVVEHLKNCVSSLHDKKLLISGSSQICGVDMHIQREGERRNSGQHSWSRLLSVLCLHKHDKAEIATKG